MQPGVPAETMRAFDGSIGHALASCAPLPFTDALGGALAGRPFTVHIVKQAKAATRS
jgi:hypothetical protein